MFVSEANIFLKNVHAFVLFSLIIKIHSYSVISTEQDSGVIM